MTRETWTKSSYSGSTNPNCVECRTATGRRIELRDTRHRDLETLSVPAREWAALLAGLKAGAL